MIRYIFSLEAGAKLALTDLCHFKEVSPVHQDNLILKSNPILQPRIPVLSIILSPTNLVRRILCSPNPWGKTQGLTEI